MTMGRSRMTFHCTIQRALLVLSFCFALCLQWYSLSIPSRPETEVALFEHTLHPVPMEDHRAKDSEHLVSPKTYRASAPALFHSASIDRTGSVVLDMLLVHAYAYQRNYTYGGACFSDPGPDDRQYLPVHEALIAVLGLEDVLRFTCPTSGFWVARDTVRGSVTPETPLWTPAWVEHIRAQQSAPPNATQTSRPQMVVHIRRGDVDLCDPVVAFRYLPNAHYRYLIEQFSEENMEVSVYSEANSTESWDEFRSGVDHLYLDTPLVDAWRAMIAADVLIMSTSSFSNVPAVFNRHGRVVYTPFWELPLPHWDVVDEDTMQRMHDTKAQLVQELC